jgi:hypothetical protein
MGYASANMDTSLGRLPTQYSPSLCASEHRSDEISCLASGCGIQLQFSPVEAHWSLGSGERVHSLIRNVYHTVHMHAPYLALETKLAWSVFALKDTPPQSALVSWQWRARALTYPQRISQSTHARSLSRPRDQARLVRVCAERHSTAG